MRQTPISNNPPPLRGRGVRPQGARVGGGHAPSQHAKIELCHRNSRDISEGVLRRPNSGFGPSFAAAKLKTAAFAARCRLAPSSSTLHALSESFLSKSTAVSTPGENCMMPRGLGGSSPVDIGSCGSQIPKSCGTSKRYCRLSDQHLSLEKTPPPHPAPQDAPSPSRGESR